MLEISIHIILINNIRSRLKVFNNNIIIIIEENNNDENNGKIKMVGKNY